MLITYNRTHPAPSNCFWFLLSQKITFSSSISLMSDRSSQVSPEHSRNRDTTAVASLTVAQPHSWLKGLFSSCRDYSLYGQELLKGGATICDWTCLYMKQGLQQIRSILVIQTNLFSTSTGNATIVFFQAKEYTRHSIKVLKVEDQNMEAS